MNVNLKTDLVSSINNPKHLDGMQNNAKFSEDSDEEINRMIAKSKIYFENEKKASS